VCEIDAEGVAWPILQDANYNAVALADDTGAVVAQRVLSPYGRVLISDPPAGAATPPLSRVGHQGLFAERLDGDTLDDPLAAGGTLAWHNRNRTLLSDLGRFAQRDPNATGQGVDSALRRHGEAPPERVVAADPLEHFGDGLHVYAYATASPTQRGDPTGLFADFFLPGPSDFVRGALEGMVEQYSANLAWDVEWATDWSLPDDAHTRGSSDWIKLAMLRGVYDTFEIGFGDYTINPLDVVSNFGRAGRGGSGAGGLGDPGRLVGVRMFQGRPVMIRQFDTGGRKLIRFDPDLIKAEVRVRPTNRADEKRQANAKAGYDRAPRGYVWHHHWERGVMQLVPKEIHRSIGHQGRAYGWPPERPLRSGRGRRRGGR